VRSLRVGLPASRAAGPGAIFSWRLFGERQHNAALETNGSLPHAFRGADFEPNVNAITADEGGGSLRVRGSHGLDPRGLQLAADVRLEAGAGTFDYTRAALDVSASRCLFSNVALNLAGGAGTAVLADS